MLSQKTLLWKKRRVYSEYKAIQLYIQLAESTDNKLAQEVLKDIAYEERVRAG